MGELLSVRQPVLHPRIQTQPMERVRIVAAQSLNSFKLQGFFPVREQADTSDQCMNVHCVCLDFGQAEKKQPTSVCEPCCKTKDKFKLHERLLIGS